MALFDNSIIGNIEPSTIWTSERLSWEEKNKDIKRKLEENNGYELLQGSGVAQGHLIGGCIEVLEMCKETKIWPSLREWEESIIFFETSEEKPEPRYLEYWLRNYASQGILQRCRGIIFGKPYDNLYYKEYAQVILAIIREELKLVDLPILYNVNFGHTAPSITIPYGARAEINCNNKTFSILESGVV